MYREKKGKKKNVRCCWVKIGTRTASWTQTLFVCLSLFHFFFFCVFISFHLFRFSLSSISVRCFRSHFWIFQFNSWKYFNWFLNKFNCYSTKEQLTTEIRTSGNTISATKPLLIACCSTFPLNFHLWFVSTWILLGDYQVNGNQGRYRHFKKNHQNVEYHTYTPTETGRARETHWTAPIMHSKCKEKSRRINLKFKIRQTLNKRLRKKNTETKIIDKSTKMLAMAYSEHRADKEKLLFVGIIKQVCNISPKVPPNSAAINVRLTMVSPLQNCRNIIQKRWKSITLSHTHFL